LSNDLLDRLRAQGCQIKELESIDVEGFGRYYAFATDGTSAVDYWKNARAALEGTGYYPLITGTENNIKKRVECNFEYARDEDGFETVAALIAAGETLDTEAWLLETERNWPELYEDIGEWPVPPPPRLENFTTPYDVLTKRPLSRVWISLLPCQKPWHVPAFMCWGAFNECPKPHEHVAMFKRWFEQYGAEPVAMTDAIVEMNCPRPTSTRDAAMVLGREQLVYCVDLFQGIDDVSTMAAALLDTRVWYFWWD
jgi:hypothetical protein